MRVIEDAKPVERRTVIEFTDFELQLIRRSLALDTPVDEPLRLENFTLYKQFSKLTDALKLDVL